MTVLTDHINKPANSSYQKAFRYDVASFLSLDNETNWQDITYSDLNANLDYFEQVCSTVIKSRMDEMEGACSMHGKDAYF
jgi:hypothetical protein